MDAAAPSASPEPGRSPTLGPPGPPGPDGGGEGADPERGQAPARGPATRRRLLLGGAALLLVLLGIGIYLLATRGRQSTDDAQVTADLLPVGVRVAGQVSRVLIRENALVKKGQPLIEIDPADYQARLRQAEAELAIAQAQAQAADAQVQVTEATSRGGLLSAQAGVAGSSVSVSGAAAQVAAAEAALQRARADARKAALDLDRFRTLVQQNAAPRERLDAAQAANDAAQAALRQAEANVAVARESQASARARVREAQGRLSQSEPIEAQIAAARAGAELAHARVRSAEAALELARLQLSYTKVSAPADGTASKLQVHEGQLVTVGQPLIELVPTETYVIANFKETQIGAMAPGQPADIEVDAYPGRTLRGKVESISGGTGSSFSLLPADNASGNFVKVVQRVPVRIAWTGLPPGLALRAGMSATVTVNTRR